MSTRRMRLSLLATSSSFVLIIFRVRNLTPLSRGLDSYIRPWQRMPKLRLFLVISTFPFLVAKRDALASFVSAAFQSSRRHPNAVQSTVPFEGLYFVPQRFQPRAKRL